MTANFPKKIRFPVVTSMALIGALLQLPCSGCNIVHLYGGQCACIP